MSTTKNHIDSGENEIDLTARDFEYSSGGLCTKHVRLALTHVRYHLVHLFSDTFGCVVAHKLRQRATVELAAGSVQTLRKALGLFEYFIGDGDRNLHTMSITSSPTSGQQRPVTGSVAVIQNQ